MGFFFCPFSLQFPQKGRFWSRFNASRVYRTYIHCKKSEYSTIYFDWKSNIPDWFVKVNKHISEKSPMFEFLPYFQGRLFLTVKAACCSVDLLEKIYLSSRLFSDVFLTFLPKRRHFHGHCLLCTGPKKFSHFIIL